MEEKETIAKEIRYALIGHYEFLDPPDIYEIKGDEIIYDLYEHKTLVADVKKKTLTLQSWKFDWYREPCPGLVLVDEKEQDTEVFNVCNIA